MLTLHRLRMHRPVVLLAIILLSSACRSGLPPLDASLPPASGDLRTLYAVRAIDVVVGTGKDARPNACLYAHYTGWLTTGTKFDSSRDTMPNGQPRSPLGFRQGARQVIAGWDAGFEGMKVGGRRRLFLPYQVAYGEEGRPPTIPARSMLVFDVELMDVTEAPSVPAGTPPAQARCKPWDQR